MTTPSDKNVTDEVHSRASAVASGSAPLNARQLDAYGLIGGNWQTAPIATLSSTLLSLRDRGLIESRIAPGVSAWLALQKPWHSSAYQWRRVPNAETCHGEDGATSKTK